MRRCLKSSKFFQPEQPASTTVVTPTRKVKPSGGNAVVACVGATFADPVVDVDVKINEARCDVEALDVDGLESIPNSRCGARP
jgi:hypothetical protein